MTMQVPPSSAWLAGGTVLLVVITANLVALAFGGVGYLAVLVVGAVGMLAYHSMSAPYPSAMRKGGKP